MASMLLPETKQFAEPQSVWTVDMSKVVGRDNVVFINDLVRIFIIQMTVQIMMYVTCPDQCTIFSDDFLILLLFISIGICFYWLVFRRLVSFD